jgi:hypothetical protein
VFQSRIHAAPNITLSINDEQGFYD